MKGNSVITPAQARAITGGRKPLVPVVYEEAVTALARCLSLEDAKVWDSKADAFAAWAKIYRDGDALRKAKALKLRAYTRMGELAKELRPAVATRVGNRIHGRGKGPHSLLVEHGLSSSEASAAVALAKLPEDQRRALYAADKPLSPVTVRTYMERSKGTEAWVKFNRSGGPRNCVSQYLAHNPSALARDMTASERRVAAKAVRELADWCDEFLQVAESKVKTSQT